MFYQHHSVLSTQLSQAGVLVATSRQQTTHSTHSTVHSLPNGGGRGRDRVRRGGEQDLACWVVDLSNGGGGNPS